MTCSFRRGGALAHIAIETAAADGLRLSLSDSERGGGVKVPAGFGPGSPAPALSEAEEQEARARAAKHRISLSQAWFEIRSLHATEQAARGR